MRSLYFSAAPYILYASVGLKRAFFSLNGRQRNIKTTLLSFPAAPIQMALTVFFVRVYLVYTHLRLRSRKQIPVIP